eukprot:GHRQ01002374.1.p1 GENE.GHRQ01002374.1~~GHRQ01002374.1.p1  ORF type:complete len:144 (-),score=33.13 GHRQ01002374.1:225-656(-)
MDSQDSMRHPQGTPGAAAPTKLSKASHQCMHAKEAAAKMVHSLLRYAAVMPVAWAARMLEMRLAAHTNDCCRLRQAEPSCYSDLMPLLLQSCMQVALLLLLQHAWLSCLACVLRTLQGVVVKQLLYEVHMRHHHAPAAVASQA